jgi:hypothetical protein
MIVWNAYPPETSPYMTRDAETPLNEPPYLIPLNFTATQQLFSPILPHPNSFNMPKKRGFCDTAGRLQYGILQEVLGTVLQTVRLLCRTVVPDAVMTVSIQYSLPQLLRP